jgi:hypothetical protein
MKEDDVLMVSEQENESPVFEKKKIEKSKNKKQGYIACKTVKVYCNEVFQLVKGEKIPKGIDKAFYRSLLNDNKITKGK